MQQEQSTVKNRPLKRKATQLKRQSPDALAQLQLDLFEDTTELERRGVLLQGPIYVGSPHLYGCWHCFAHRLWTHLIDWGNSRGPSVALPICDHCHQKRSKLTDSDQLLFDQACRQNAVEILGGAIACRA